MFKKNTSSICEKHGKPEKINFIKIINISFFLSIIPSIAIICLFCYQKLTFYQSFSLILIFFIQSIFIIIPYLSDLKSLKQYLENLNANKNNPIPPNLKYLDQIEKFSTITNMLQNSSKRKEKQLDSLGAQNKILFENSQNIIIFLDQNLNIVNINNVGINILATESINLKLIDITNNKKLDNKIKEVQKTKKSQNISTTININNQKIHFEVLIEPFPVKEPNLKISIILVMSDITSPQNKDDSMKNFITNASHEILTPLTSIIGFIETLKNLKSNEEDTRQRFLNIIETNAKQMSVLVRDLVFLSKIEQDNKNKEPYKKVNIIQVVKESIDNLYFFAKNKNIEITLNTDKEIPHITGNSKELVKVVNNLINNAIKYSFENTEIIIEIGLENKLSKQTKLKIGTNVLYISVINTGIDIKSEDIANLTQRFYRGNNTKSNQITGFGLGLAIVKEILDKHNAKLAIKAISKNQNQFTIRLPVQKEEMDNL